MPLGLSRSNYFTNKRKNKVRTIEVSLHEDVSPMQDHIGIHTINNINPPTSDDLFYITPDNVFPGYIAAPTGKRSLDLIDGKKKLVKSICNSYYHSIMDDISEIVKAIHLNPGYDLIIDVSELAYAIIDKDRFENKYFDYFCRILKKNKINYKLVTLAEYDVIHIDNFKHVYFPYDSGQKSLFVYDFFKQGLSKKELKVEPTRKIFVSRTRQKREDYVAPGLTYTNDSRIDDGEGLDALFGSLGFEIVIAEEIQDFMDQFKLFYGAKVIAGLTGSGLTNAAFMQPGGTMIEIATPLIVPIAPPGGAKDTTNPWFTQEIHNFYKDLSFFHNHNFVAIQNGDRSLEEIKENLEKNPALLEYLKNV